jgi:2-hydroxychromene-2-carboxylate isomerase
VTGGEPATPARAALPAAAASPPRPADASAAAPLDFWFDFISPFGYFASLRIDDLAARHGRTVAWHPLLVGVTVLKVMGLKAIPATPLKGEYAARQIARYGRRHGLQLARDPLAPPMNPLPAGRCFAWLLAHAPAHAKPFARAALHAHWAEGRALDQPAELLAAAAAAGLPADLAQAAVAAPDAAALLRAEVDAAVARGVFGSPFFIADGEPFFGLDNLELLDEWFARGGW